MMYGNLSIILKLDKVILIGHSMGGKTAMKMTALQPQRVEKLVVIDIAPVANSSAGHDDVFRGLFAVKKAQPQTRQQAKPILESEIADPSVVQFMLKSFEPTSSEYFRFNLTALFEHYAELMDWQEVYANTPTLFIKGGLSSYIKPEYTETILKHSLMRPRSLSMVVGTGFNAEKPDFVIRAIDRFLNKN